MNVYTIKLITGEEVLIKTGEVDLEENWYDKSIISVVDPRVMIIDPESGPKGAIPFLSGADETSTDFTPVYKIPTSRIITIQIPSAFVENVYLQQTQKPEKQVSGL